MQAAYELFEEQRAGRGDQFLRHLRELEVLLASNPRMGVGVKRGIRKLLMPKFDIAWRFGSEAGTVENRHPPAAGWSND